MKCEALLLCGSPRRCSRSAVDAYERESDGFCSWRCRQHSKGTETVLEAKAMTTDYRLLLLQLIGSLTLCDHMGDVSNDVDMVLKKLGIEWDSPDDGDDEWGALGKRLHEMGVTTLYGSALWSPDEDEE